MAKDDDDDLDTVRGRDISKQKKIREKLLKLYAGIEKGFENQWGRSNDQIDYWDIYNCKLGSGQFYNGNAKIYVPIVKNAIDARKTRFTNQIFPLGGRYVEVISEDGTRADAIGALLEYYVYKSNLRSQVMPALMKAGDIEGQYNLLVGWAKYKRHVTWKQMTQPEMEEGMDNPAAEEVETIEEEVVEAQHPEVEVIPDSDILVLPNTSNSIDDAIESGGSVTIIRRWGKDRIQRAIDDGDILETEGEELMESLDKKSPPDKINQPSKQVDSAGIKGGEGQKYANIYLTYTRQKVKGEDRLCQIFFGGPDKILGCRLNPLWSDRVPLLSVPIEKVADAFKGISKVRAVAPLQYAANDAVNEAWDSAAYALMPVVMTDPEKNPRTGSMILSMSAIWETSPKDTQILQFPQLWQHGFEMVNACKNEVSQTLNVSPAAITQGISPQQKQKRNQAEIAQEQQVDLLTTADAVTIVEEGILNPLLAMFVEFDHQFRDEDLTIRSFGEMGIKAEMEKIPPLQMNKRYQFKWRGVEQARNAQQIQQQISTLNTVQQATSQAGPQALRGYKINLVPIITLLFENAFGPRLAPQIWETPETQMPVPIAEEHLLMSEGFEVPTHPQDDDQQHIQAHMMLLQQMQEQVGAKHQKKIQAHIWQHMQQAQQKQQQAMGMPPPGAQPQQPPQKKPQAKPKAGAMPGQPRPSQGPPGMIHQDQIKGTQMPRKMGGGPGIM